MAIASFACSAGSQDPNRTGTGPSGDGAPIVQKTGGVTATSCKTKHPIKSWDDRTSKYGFCERLGFRLTACELPFSSGPPRSMCDYHHAADQLRVDIANECMTLDFDVANVPSMIETLEACVCGDRYRYGKSTACVFRDCAEKVACLRAAGFKWTSRRPKQARR